MTWVYLRADNGLWTVGFFKPGSFEWVAESDHQNKEMAAQRVHWLNGGNSQDRRPIPADLND